MPRSGRAAQSSILSRRRCGSRHGPDHLTDARLEQLRHLLGEVQRQAVKRRLIALPHRLDQGQRGVREWDTVSRKGVLVSLSDLSGPPFCPQIPPYEGNSPV